MSISRRGEASQVMCVVVVMEKCSVKAAATKSLQSCPTLCDPIDGSPPGSPVPGILQARKPEWGAIAFSVCKGMKALKCVHLFLT